MKRFIPFLLAIGLLFPTVAFAGGESCCKPQAACCQPAQECCAQATPANEADLPVVVVIEAAVATTQAPLPVEAKSALKEDPSTKADCCAEGQPCCVEGADCCSAG